MNGSSAAKSPESAPRKRLMKEILKSSIGGMHFSTKLLYGASLSLRNRKKFKRMKKSNKKVLQENLLTEDSIPADMGPSTSDSDPAGTIKHSHKRANCKDANDLCSNEPTSQLVKEVSGATGGLHEPAGEYFSAAK